MTYNDILNMAVETHMGCQYVSGGVNGNVDNNERRLYFKYLIMAERELYNLLAPNCSEAWAVAFAYYFLLKQKICTNCFQFEYLRILEVIADMDDAPGGMFTKTTAFVLPRIDRHRMIYLWQRKPVSRNIFCYAENYGNSISIYKNYDIGTPRINIFYVPTYEDAVQGKYRNLQRDVEYFEEEERNTKSISETRAVVGETTPDSQMYLPDKYSELLFNGLLTYLYRNMPTFSSSVKEQVAYQKWESGKAELLKKASFEEQINANNSITNDIYKILY